MMSFYDEKYVCDLFVQKYISGQTHIFMYVVPTFILCNINKEKHNFD